MFKGVSDDIITDSSTISSKFNTHFAEVAPFLDANIPRLPDDPAANIQAISNSFAVRNIDAEEVHKILQFFKSKGSLLIEVPSFTYKKFRFDSSNTFRFYKRSSSPRFLS